MGKALLDANVLVGVVRDKDALHEQAVELLEKWQEEVELWALNLVIQEAATVVSMRDGMEAAKIFFRGYKNMVDVEIKLDEELEELSWGMFLRQVKKGTSFVDCANLAVIEKYKLGGILTFDKFYPKELRLV